MNLHIDASYLVKPIQGEAVVRELDRILAKPQTKLLDVVCFGSFDVFANGKPVYFERSISKELLACLIDRRGVRMTIPELYSIVCDSRRNLSRQSVYQGLYSLKAALNAFPDESAEARCKTVKKAIDRFVGDAEQFDDITMLSVRFHSFQDDESIVTPADSASTERVWDFISRRARKAELSAKITNRAQIIVDEIYSNIHLYSGATKAQVFCHITPAEMTLLFKDNGKPYNPLMSQEPDVTLSTEDREFGGLGILMVKKMASDLKYAYEDGYNLLTVTIQIAPQQ
jgi:anti-sigma regulatory factor (Ser/Thr protein kinase)